MPRLVLVWDFSDFVAVATSFSILHLFAQFLNLSLDRKPRILDRDVCRCSYGWDRGVRRRQTSTHLFGQCSAFVLSHSLQTIQGLIQSTIDTHAFGVR